MDNIHLDFFRQLNDYFDKVYVVTVPRLKERQDQTTKLLMGLDFEFVQGVDKEQLSNTEIEEFYDNNAHLSLSRFDKPLRRGEIACALSHLQVYRQAISNGFDRILVLEDDIDIIAESLNQIKAFLNGLPNDWELAYLGCYLKNVSPGNTAWIKQSFYILMSILGIHKWSIRRILNIYPKPINDHVLESGNHEGAYAYAVTLAGCKKLLAFNQPIKLSADNLFSHLITNRFLKGYLAKDVFFGHKSSNGKGIYTSETST